MNKAVKVFIYFLFLLWCFACKTQTERVKPLLQNAEKLLEEKPDSALVLLEQITGAEKLKKSLYYDYFLLNIQAKYKNYKDISADTLIFKIRDYYSKKEDVEKTALATFYSGRVYQEQENYEKALEEFLETEKLLQKSNNLNLKGLCQNAIGDIYSKQFLKEKAVFYYQQAKKYFNETGEDKNEIITTNLIANGFLIQKKTDSAFIYYNEALDLATKTGEFGLQSSILMNLGVPTAKTATGSGQ